MTVILNSQRPAWRGLFCASNIVLGTAYRPILRAGPIYFDSDPALEDTDIERACPIYLLEPFLDASLSPTSTTSGVGAPDDNLSGMSNGYRFDVKQFINLSLPPVLAFSH